MKLKTKMTTIDNSLNTQSSVDDCHPNENVSSEGKKKKLKRKKPESAENVDSSVRSSFEFPIKKKKAVDESTENIPNDNVPTVSADNIPLGSTKSRNKKKKRISNTSEIPQDTNATTPDDDGKPQGTISKNSEDEGQLSDDESKSKLSAKEVKNITAKYLRSSFQTASGLSILRKFVKICTDHTERDLASEYIESSGNVFEILRLLDGSDTKNLSNAALVFSGMHIVIMKILEKYPANVPASQEACRQFMNGHLSIVHAMMSKQSTPKQRKIVLRLLTSIVSLGDFLPREVLAHLSFHQETVALMSQQTKPSDPQSVRTCFIHFILSFLVDSEVSVVRALLDKRGLLSSIFPDLIYDSHETVHLVLQTIKTYILQNTGITKTLKLHVFSTPVVQNLVSLYNWKGPRNWPGSESKKRKSLPESVDPDEQAIAVEAVHDFLTVLLTSNRHGIIFNDKTLGTSGKKHNQLVNTILQSLERPWDHEKPCDLVCKILIACPDLIKPQLTYTEGSLEPRPSKKWISVMDFVKRILGGVAPEICLKNSIPEFTHSQIANATVALTMPSTFLKKAVVPSLAASNIILRHEAVTTLIVMLSQAKKFLKIAEKNVGFSEYEKLQCHIRDYISKNVPSVGDIVKIWGRIDEEDEGAEAISLDEIAVTPSRSVHFSSILDLIQVYAQVLRESIGCTTVGVIEENPQTLLTSLSDLEDIDEEQLNLMKIKAIQIIYMLSPNCFASEDKFLRNVLLFLIQLLDNPSEQLRANGMETIKTVLKDSKIFKNCQDQMDIWFNSFSCLENLENKTEVAQWLVKIVPKAEKHADEYEEVIAEMEKKIVVKYRAVWENDKSKLLQPMTSIPSILCAALKKLQKKTNEATSLYISFIISMTLHCQVSPTALLHLCNDIEDERLKYLNSWNDGNTPISLKKVFSKNVFGTSSKILLSKKAISFEEITNAAASANSSYEVLNLIKMTVFYLTQLIQKETLTQEQFDRHKHMIISLLDFYKHPEEGTSDLNGVLECSRYILTHPILLNSFTPIPKAKNIAETIVTTGLPEIIEKIVSVNEKSNLHGIFLPFKDKLMSDLRSVLKKCVGGWVLRRTQSLIAFIELLELKSADLQELLKCLTNLPKVSFVTEDKKSLSIWGTLAPRLLDLLSEKAKSEVIADLPKETQMIHKLCINFTYLKSTEIAVGNWEISLHGFLKTFPHHIAAVDPKTFNSLLENKLDESTIRLISFLTERNPKLIPLSKNYLSTRKSAMENYKLVFSVLSSNLSYKWDAAFLEEIRKQYQEDIIDYFSLASETKDWINQHIDAITYLMNSCFSLETCEGISRTILSSGDKLETVNLSYTKLLQNLFTRLSELHQNPQQIHCQSLQIFIRLIVSALKKNAKDEERIQTLCKYICHTVKKLRSVNKNFIFEDLNKNYSWPQFTRFSLRSGLKNSKNDSTTVLPLLQTLAEVCDIAYEDKSENEYVKTLFEMTVSHSEFMNLMLSSQSLKKDLLRLIFILIKKNPTVMTSAHIAVYLSAYNATLSECDQQILLILNYYESYGIHLTEYKPYLFGQAAASHYSVMQKADTAIWRQPPISQVLQLFKIESVENTVSNFPVHRILEPYELQRGESVYDPAFYLPLLLHLLAENNVIACHNVTHSGTLALIFAACGSTCPKIRMTAFTIMSRFYFHVEATRSKEKLLWMRIIDALRNSIAVLESPLSDVRLHCFISTFLAKSTLVASQPLNPLYAPLHKFFMAKQELDLKTIPDFLMLFNSCDINHLLHRHWILQVVRDGLKTNFDMDVASKSHIFRTLMYFYESLLSDRETNILILEIINATVRIPKAGLVMCEESGLLVWLSDVAEKMTLRNIDGIELIVNIVRNLLNTILNSNDKDPHTQFVLLDILKTLIPKLSRNTKMSCYRKLLACVQDILKSKSLCKSVDKDDIQSLIDVSKNIVGDVKDSEEILIHKCEFVSAAETAESSDEIMSCKGHLKNIVIAWRSQIKS